MRSVVQIYLGPPVAGRALIEPIGAVAQLGERRPCKAEVVGSNPISSTSLASDSTIEMIRSSGMRGSLEISRLAWTPEWVLFIDN